jgi:acetyltransferase-like isoleucine patch superfamily enzyme
MKLSKRSLRKLPWVLRYRTGTKLASDVRKLIIMATHRHCRVEFQGPVYLGPGFRLQIPDAGELIIGPGVDFRRGFVCEISGNGRVTIGAGATFTSHSLIQCTTTIDIGKRATFGQSLMIADGAHKFRDHTKHLLDQGYDFHPITIGDNAVVMSKVTIISDIGEGAVVGAHSLVNRPVPAFCFAAGTPVKVIEYFGPPERRPETLDAGRDA